MKRSGANGFPCRTGVLTCPSPSKAAKWEMERQVRTPVLRGMDVEFSQAIEFDSEMFDLFIEKAHA